jgi:hypothetical protein
MRSRSWGRAKGAVVVFGAAFALMVNAACSDSAPPLEELSMRDALGADPTVVHGLPPAAQEALADKFQSTLETQISNDEAEAAGAITPAQEVRAIDDARLSKELDALLAADVTVSNGKLVAHARGISSAHVSPPPSLPPLPQIEGDEPTITKDEETRALSGNAGDVVRHILAQTHARRVMRVTGWPMAAVAIDDVVYVNASWLVAMSAREPKTATPNAALSAGSQGGVSFITPQSLRGNPYHLYDTLNQCIGDVQSRCQTCLAGGACDDNATLGDFNDGKSECSYLLAGGTRPVYSGGPVVYSRVQELCAMALLDVCTVADCVTKESCTLPVGLSVSASVTLSSSMLVSADVFVTDDHCVKALDLCLSGTPFGLDAGFDLSLDIKVEGCDDPFKSCGSAFAACGSTCSTGRCTGTSSGASCTSCGGCGSCSGFGSDSRTSGSCGGSNTGYGSGGFQSGGNANGTGAGNGSSSSGGCGSCGGSGSGSGGGGGGTGIDAGGGTMDAGTASGGRRVDTKHPNDQFENDAGEDGGEGGASGVGGNRLVDHAHEVDTHSHEGNLVSADDPSLESPEDSPPELAGAPPNAIGCATADDRRRPAGDPPFAPATTLFWLLLPIAYLGARTRRPS